MPRRKYRVISRTPTLDHAPGDVFTADLDPGFEQRLIARGALEKVKRGEETEKTEEKKDDAGNAEK